MRAPLEDAQREEQEHDGKRRGQRAEPRTSERVVDLNPGHGVVSLTSTAVRVNSTSGLHERSIDVVQCRASGKGHRELQLVAEHREHTRDARFAVSGKPPQIRAADQDRASAERDRLQHVDSTTHASINQHRDASGNAIRNVRQGIDRGDRAVQLAAAVVGHDDAQTRPRRPRVQHRRGTKYL